MQGPAHRLLAEVMTQLEATAGRDRFVDQVHLGCDGRPTDQLGHEAHRTDPTEPVGAQRAGERGVVIDRGPAHERYHPTALRRRQHPIHLGRRRTGPDPHDQVRQRPVAQHVRLAEQARRVVRNPVVVLPPGVVGAGQLGRIHLGEVRRRRPRAELQEVVGTAGLGAHADRRPLPAPERLALHDGTGDGPVHVGVPHLDGIQPGIHLGRVQGVDAPGQAVVHGVLDLDGLGQGVHGDQAQDRSEVLGAMEL